MRRSLGPLLLLTSLVGAGTVFVATSPHGPGVSSDSVAYVSTARNLLSGEGFTTFLGSPMVYWPPLFPILLAVPGLVGIEPSDAARVINTFAFGLTVLLAGHLLRIHLRSHALIVLGTCAVALSYPLLTVSSMVWTEPLFVLLSLGFVLCLGSFLREEKRVQLILMSVLAALAGLQRYVGITLVLVGAISILMTMRGTPWRRQFRYVLVFGSISILPVAFWVARNYLLTSTLTGGRPPSSSTLSDNLAQVVEVLFSWLVQRSLQLSLAVEVGVVAGATALAGSILFWSLYTQRENRRHVTSLCPVAAFVFTYALFLGLSSAAIAFDRIDGRLLAPVYVFCVVLALVALDELIHRTPEWRYDARTSWLAFGVLLIVSGAVLHQVTLTPFLPERIGTDPGLSRFAVSTMELALVVTGLLVILLRGRVWLARAFVIGSCSLWVLSALPGAYAFLDARMQGRIGLYNEPPWRESAIVDWLSRHPIEGSVYSNAPDAFYFLVGGSAAESPGAEYGSPDSLSEWQPEADRSFLVWFHNVRRSRLLDLEGVTTAFNTELVVAVSDGAVYSITW